MTTVAPVSLRVHSQGGLLRVSVSRSAPAPRGVRGIIREFTSAARKRLMDLMARISYSQLDGFRHRAVFLTLTYLDSPSPLESARQLDVFLKRVRRRFPSASGIWRKELQKRGAIHYHLIIFNIPYWHKSDVQKVWGEVIGQERPFTRIEAIRTRNGVFYYVSKYMTKDNDDDDGGSDDGERSDASGLDNDTYLTAGNRWWGVFNRKNLPLAPAISTNFPYDLNSLGWIKSIAGLFWPPAGEWSRTLIIDGEEMIVPSLGFTLYLSESRAAQLHATFARILIGDF